MRIREEKGAEEMECEEAQEMECEGADEHPYMRERLNCRRTSVGR